MLTTAKEINAAINAGAYGGSGKYVFCTISGQTAPHRIIRAKIRKGVLHVRVLSTGAWVRPANVWEE